jgi:hypothetical protein
MQPWLQQSSAMPQDALVGAQQRLTPNLVSQRFFVAEGQSVASLHEQ